MEEGGEEDLKRWLSGFGKNVSDTVGKDFPTPPTADGHNTAYYVHHGNMYGRTPKIKDTFRVAECPTIIRVGVVRRSIIVVKWSCKD